MFCFPREVHVHVFKHLVLFTCMRTRNFILRPSLGKQDMSAKKGLGNPWEKGLQKYHPRLKVCHSIYISIFYVITVITLSVIFSASNNRIHNNKKNMQQPGIEPGPPNPGLPRGRREFYK